MKHQSRWWEEWQIQDALQLESSAAASLQATSDASHIDQLPYGALSCLALSPVHSVKENPLMMLHYIPKPGSVGLLVLFKGTM